MVKRVRRGVVGAEKSEMPKFIKPQLATLKSKAPVGPQWLHEIKFDGYRVQVHLNKGGAEGLHPQWAGLDKAVLSHCRRARHSRTGHYRRGGGGRPEGRTNFSELQAELAAGPATAFRVACPSGHDICEASPDEKADKK
jgi:bifunctional non-homologous end joining protein LigD